MTQPKRFEFLVECIACDGQYPVEHPTATVPVHRQADDDRPITPLKCVGSGKNGRYVGRTE